MRLDPIFLRSRVAQRIFLLFILCALLPVTALAVISYVQETGHLQEQSERRLRYSTKAAAVSIYERLVLLEAELKMLASNLYAGGLAPSTSPLKEVSEELTKSFLTVTLVR